MIWHPCSACDAARKSPAWEAAGLKSQDEHGGQRLSRQFTSGCTALRSRTQRQGNCVHRAAPIKAFEFAVGEAERLQCIFRHTAITKETRAGLACDALGLLPLDGLT